MLGRTDLFLRPLPPARAQGGCDATSGVHPSSGLPGRGRCDARDWFLALKSNMFHTAVGIEFVKLHEDGATMRLQVRDEHLNGAGVVHGGVTFTLADSALGYGIYKVLGKPCTTAEMKINYLRPAGKGMLVARSRIVRAGRRLVVARAEVHSGDAQVAEALSTFAVLGPAGSAPGPRPPHR